MFRVLFRILLIMMMNKKGRPRSINMESHSKIRRETQSKKKMRCKWLDACGRKRCSKRACPPNSASGEITSTNYCAKRRSSGQFRPCKIYLEQTTEVSRPKSGPIMMITMSKSTRRMSRLSSSKKNECRGLEVRGWQPKQPRVLLQPTRGGTKKAVAIRIF